MHFTLYLISLYLYIIVFQSLSALFHNFPQHYPFNFFRTVFYVIRTWWNSFQTIGTFCFLFSTGMWYFGTLWKSGSSLSPLVRRRRKFVRTHKLMVDRLLQILMVFLLFLCFVILIFT
uniref:Uncharacterized protein n=1 Tax=Cacopsylla melanoneura TaxID=428564 RepID=A0A8D9BFX5_9HEMI